MTESQGKISREKLSSICDIIQNDLSILKACIDNPEISEIGILRILKSSKLGVYITTYLAFIEKQQSLANTEYKLQAESNITEYNIRK